MPLTNERRWYQEPALVLERLRPQVREILEQHGVPQVEAERLVQDTLLALLYKWDEISNPDHWLLKTLEHRCLRLYGNAAPAN
jgi:DNA-directed RNA polymerase specialized sigma24 family protein